MQHEFRSFRDSQFICLVCDYLSASLKLVGAQYCWRIIMSGRSQSEMCVSIVYIIRRSYYLYVPKNGNEIEINSSFIRNHNSL